MASPIPKPAATRQRRNRAASGATLEAPSAKRAELPPGEWHELTKAWWATIWSSPMASEWVDADVPALHRIARLDSAFWATLDDDLANKLAGTIDRLSRQFGLDPMARRSLQWEVKRVETPVLKAAPTRARDPRLRSVG